MDAYVPQEPNLLTNCSPIWVVKIPGNRLMILESEWVEFAGFSKLLAAPLGLAADVPLQC